VASPLNGTARGIAIVDFLATRPSETFTLSELARRVGLNKSTAHTVIHTLHDAGWLFQSPHDQRYGLGPRLTLIGEAAARCVPELVLARPFMSDLAADLRAECVFSVLVQDEIVILGATGAIRLGGHSVSPGGRMPCTAPLGTVFIAWLDEAERAQRRARGLDRGYDVMADELAAIRGRGFAATLASSEDSTLLRLLAELPGAYAERSETLQSLEERLSAVAAAAYLASFEDGTAAQSVDAVMAPVFQDGAPRYALTASRLGRWVDLDELTRLGERVRHSADQITQRLSELSQHGRAD
jgi:DNA-binding IclR family transcriptional regulator